MKREKRGREEYIRISQRLSLGVIVTKYAQMKKLENGLKVLPLKEKWAGRCIEVDVLLIKVGEDKHKWVRCGIGTCLKPP